MARTNFFANTTINFELIDFPTVYYPSPQADVKDTFDVPKHNQNTPNLLVFLDGSLVQRGLAYDDINSTQIKFKTPVRINQEVYVILLVQKNGGNSGGTNPAPSAEKLKWQGISQNEVNMVVNTAANIPENPNYDGQIFYTSDTADQYLALSNNTKLKITDLIFVSALPPQGIENKLYLTPTALAFWNKTTTSWNLFQKQVNSQTPTPTDNAKTAGAILTKLTGPQVFNVGAVVGWNKTLNRYDLVSDTIEPIGVVSKKEANSFSIVHFGDTGVISPQPEGTKLFLKNGAIGTDETGTPIGRVVDRKVFVELKDKQQNGGTVPTPTKQIKNVVLMLGNNLTQGEHTEVQVVFPYSGVLKKVYSNRSMQSQGEFTFVLKYGDPQPLQTISQISFASGETRKTTNLNLNINSAVFLLDVISTNHQTVGLNIILEIETEA